MHTHTGQIQILIRENVNISQQLAQLTEKATNLTNENDKLTLKEMEGRTRISLLDTEIEKLSRRNAYRQRVIEELTEKCRSQEGKMEQVSRTDIIFFCKARLYGRKKCTQKTHQGRM